MGYAAVALLVVALFVAIAGLLGYGFRVFGRGDTELDRPEPGKPTVNMRLEVLWTGLSAALLLAVFLMVR
ncbi:MAG TPA: hypothetical protein VKX16_19275 [Chloroflexota bacterium]|nr:hypothetical protein [Chloroflexota bacterium]